MLYLIIIAVGGFGYFTGQNMMIGLIFFGFDCLAIGWLILRSTFLPWLLGAMMMFAGVCYLIDTFATLLVPAFDPPFDLLLPAYVAEAALTLWLLICGVNDAKWKTLAGALGNQRMAG
jgi:hypothetical protein